ncbi:MAG: hypothetical protein AAGE59_21470 [Cyanobacteria bacterium P01_F01_bin.86]
MNRLDSPATPAFVQFVTFLRQLVDEAVEQEFGRRQILASLQRDRLRRARLQQQEWLDLRNRFIHSGIAMGLLAISCLFAGAFILANSLPKEVVCGQPKSMACWLHTWRS